MRSIATLLLFAPAETSGFVISRRRFVAAAIPLVAAAPALQAYGNRSDETFQLIYDNSPFNFEQTLAVHSYTQDPITAVIQLP